MISIVLFIKILKIDLKLFIGYFIAFLKFTISIHFILDGIICKVDFL